MPPLVQQESLDPAVVTLGGEDDDTQSVSDIDDHPGASRFELVNSEDEEETALLAQHIEAEADLGNVFEPDVGNVSAGHNNLRDDVVPTDGNTFRWLWRDRTRTDTRLLPISILFEAIDGSGSSTSAQAPHRFEAWSIVRRAVTDVTAAAGCPRLPMDPEARSFKCIALSASALKTLDARRILDYSIIATYSQLLLDDHLSNPLVDDTFRPKVWVAPPGSQLLSPDLLVNLFCKVSV